MQSVLVGHSAPRFTLPDARDGGALNAECEKGHSPAIIWLLSATVIVSPTHNFGYESGILGPADTWSQGNGIIEQLIHAARLQVSLRARDCIDGRTSGRRMISSESFLNLTFF